MAHLILTSDGSDASRIAQEFAAALPFRERPTGTLVAVTPLPITLSEFYLEEALVQQARQLDKTVARPRLDLERAKLSDRFARLAVDSRIGAPGPEIVLAAECANADLIVVGSRGLSTVSRWLMGSVSDWVTRHATRSVLVVRHGDDSANTPVGPPRRVLFAIDGSAASNHAIGRFADMKGELARIVIVAPTLAAAGLEMMASHTAFLDAERKRAGELLKEAQATLAGSFSRVETSILDAESIPRAIVADAEKWRADLIVMGNLSKGRLERFLLGSTSISVLRDAPCSVWIEKLREPPRDTKPV